MTTRPNPDQDDFEKLSSLIREYTMKLRSTCEMRVKDRYRRNLMLLALVVGLTILFAVMYLLLNPNWVGESSSFRDPLFSPFLTIALILSPIISISASLFLRSSFRYSYDAELVAATVERLVRMASQYNDHAKNRIGDQFELELRLSEAEATLKMYRKVFFANRDWSAKNK